MTVPQRIVCHIKTAISDQTRPDMGWGRAPLATAHAALRQAKRPGSRVRRGVGLALGPPLLVLSWCLLCFVLVVVATKSQAPGAAAEVEGVLLDCRLDHRDLGCWTKEDARACATDQTCLYPMRRLAHGKMDGAGYPRLPCRPGLFTRRSFWRLDPVHHYLPEPWMGLGIDCTGTPGLLGWDARTDTRGPWI